MTSSRCSSVAIVAWNSAKDLRPKGGELLIAPLIAADPDGEDEVPLRRGEAGADTKT